MNELAKRQLRARRPPSVSLIRVLGANEATPVSRTVTTQPLADTELSCRSHCVANEVGQCALSTDMEALFMAAAAMIDSALNASCVYNISVSADAVVNNDMTVQQVGLG